MLDICPDIIYQVFLLTFITRMDQMIFYEEQLWGTASAITVDICQTND